VKKIQEKDQAPPFMRFFHANFSADTAHLDHESVGIYIRLINWYWLQQKPLKASRVLGFLGLNSNNSSKALAVLDEYYDLLDGCYHHSFLDQEIEAVKAFKNTKKEAGKLGGKAKAKNAKANKPKEKQPVASKALAKGKQSPSKALANPSYKDKDKDKDKESNNKNTLSDSSSQTKINEHLFEKFWLAGMRKDGKKEAKQKMAVLLKGQKGNEAAFIEMLCSDVKNRLDINQQGFSSLHPKTYLNNERWNDSLEPPKAITKSVFDKEPEGSYVEKHTNRDWAIGLEGVGTQLTPNENRPPIESYEQEN